MERELDEEIEVYMQRVQPKNFVGNRRPVSLAERLRKDRAETTTPSQKIVLGNSQEWSMKLDITRKHINDILTKHKTKRWDCIIPTSIYPLPREELEKVYTFSIEQSKYCPHIYLLMLYADSGQSWILVFAPIHKNEIYAR